VVEDMSFVLRSIFLIGAPVLQRQKKELKPLHATQTFLDSHDVIGMPASHEGHVEL